MNLSATAEASLATTGLAWTPALLTGDARMDETHEDFVNLLNRLLATPVSEQLPLYQRFVAHTRAHFAQEERWMVATGFAPDNCHASHHATILETLDAVVPHFHNGDPDIINRLAEALLEWFPQHAASMDAGLALHMQAVGFDSRTETLAQAIEPPSPPQSGCGGSACT